MPQGLAKLFIGQLNFNASEEDVRQLFEFYGDVLHVNVLRDRHTGKSTGSAFVTFSCTEEADAAILALHGVYNMDRDKPLQVSYCEKTPTISRFGFRHATAVAQQNSANPTPKLGQAA